MSDIKQKIINSVTNATTTDIIIPVEFSTLFENEFLMFFKPECFKAHSPQSVEKIIEMILQKFDEHQVQISGIINLPGESVDELQVMDKHYGFINKMSKNASKLVTEEEKQKLMEVLNIENIDEYNIYGGHEFLAKYPQYTGEQLNEMWQEKGSKKLRSGFYVQKYEIGGEKVVLINAFHAVQLAHFIKEDHNMVIMIGQTNTDWDTLKNVLAGDTFPDKALPESIRGELYKNKEKYQVNDVSIENNFAHLSAGPFEAMYEINNFIGGIDNNYKLDKTNLYKLMIKEGISEYDADTALKNPEGTFEIDGEQIEDDLFTVTENISSFKAVDMYKKYLNVLS